MARPLYGQLARLNKLFDEAENLPNDQFRAEWARYLCVLTAGFLENAIAGVYEKYAILCANDSISGFVTLVLNRIQNPKANKFVEVAGSFKKDWGRELEEYMAENGRKEAIDSIMANRHLIAHGKDSGITIVRLRVYLDSSIEVIKQIERQCGVSII